MAKRTKNKDPFDVFPKITCAVCTDCREILDQDGNPTGRCYYGGPFSGYAKVREKELPE